MVAQIQGENRTFPNILSSEAVQGSEYFKWGSGSPIETLLTLHYTRNVIGSMEFTPVGMSVKNCKATNGFMLGMTVVYESAMQTLAHSCHVYPGMVVCHSLQIFHHPGMSLFCWRGLNHAKQQFVQEGVVSVGTSVL